MSIKGFSVGGVVQRYDYTALDNLPQGQGVSDDLKAALLQLARKVAYIDDQGQTYYDDLYDALYPEKTLLSITANFQQGQAVVYNTDSLDTLKQYLTVTAVYDDASTEIVPSSAYTLSGTLTTGTSVITVTYEGKTDAFNVVVTAAPMSFPVTNNLTGCTTSNSASNVAEGSTYNAVITASSDYTLVGATVSITMGGTDITTSAYSGGVITISNVNGALIISVTAVERVLTSISAVYTQSGTVYDTDTLDSLKADLVVTATYSDSSTQTVPAADYALSGTLTVGTSTITVSYGGKTATFDVTVTEAINWDIEWDYTKGSPLNNGFVMDAGTASVMDGEYFALTPTQSKYGNLHRNPDFKAANGILEIVVKWEQFIDSTKTQFINMPKLRIVVYGNTLRFVTDTSDNDIQIFSGLELSKDTTIRIVYGATSGATVFINGVSVYTWENALPYDTTRFLLNSLAATTIMYIRTIRLKSL